MEPPLYANPQEVREGTSAVELAAFLLGDVPAYWVLAGTLVIHRTGEILLASSNLVLWLQGAVRTCDGSLEFGELAWPTALVPSLTS